MILSVCGTPAQQAIPPDIAARDRQLADQLNRNTQRTFTIEQLEQMQRATNDQRLRFYYETWLEENWKKEWGLVFIPPATPCLAAPLTRRPDPDYPSALANVVGEPFFMVFSSTQVGGRLDERQLRRMTRHCESRDRLVAALRARLATLADTPPDQRIRTLTEFATAQAKALHKLEAEAESLREEFSYLDDGSALLKRRDNPAPGEPGGQPAFFGPLLAAQFHPGLSIDQRQLLAAIAQESKDHSEKTTTPTHVHFLPATARIRWPLNDDPQVFELMQRLQAIRQTLADELTRAIIDSPTNQSRRQLRKIYTELATRQVPQFDELHRLADEIRVLLANVRYPDQPPDSDLPPELVRLAGQHAARELVFQTRIQQLVQELGRLFSPTKFRLGTSNHEPVIEVEAGPGSNTPPKTEQKKLHVQLLQINEWLVRNHRDLQVRAKSVNEEIKRHQETLPLAQAEDVRALAASLARTYADEANWLHYADYHTAVLTPGLSPAQRRLLFNAALRDLEKHRLQAAN